MSYFITDPIEFGDTPIEFEKSLRNTLDNHNIDIVCFRDKTSLNKKELAQICLKICRDYNIKKVLINSDIELCKELGFDGIHLNSLQFDCLEEFSNSKLFTIISCHTEEEVSFSQKFRTDAVTYSPIFYKEKKGAPKGIQNLQNIVHKYQTPTFSIFALGGIITNDHIEEIIKSHAKGFASIRYFKI
ncbi:thiamine phosphate synthase [Arcobacteraceae bacterium]|nr:thiamine phosphate synthase [Arcobacteraceae bacterium]